MSSREYNRRNNERRWAKGHHTGKVCTKHPELGGARYCYECVGCRRIIDRNRSRKHAATRAAQRREWGRRLKAKVIAHYGGECKDCGITDIDMLTIDHERGGGNRHRLEIGGGGIMVYRWLMRHGFPHEYGVRCFNCNIKKYLERMRRGTTIA